MNTTNKARNIAPRRGEQRHRPCKDELGRIADMRRLAANGRRDAKKLRPGRRYHTPKGRRASLRRGGGPFARGSALPI